MWRVAFLLAVLAGTAILPARALPLTDQLYRISDSGRFLTSVTIDGQGPFSFVIDTAASRTVLYEHVRAQLNLTRSQPDELTVYGINSVARALPVKPGALTVAGQEIAGLTLGVLPDNGREESGVDGVLGIDVLARYFVVLDRSTMRLMLLTPGSEAARRYRDWSGMPLNPRPLRNIPIDFWYLRGEFGQAHLTCLFDLGAGFSLLNWAAAERLGIHKADFPLTEPLPAVLRDVLGTEEPVVKVLGLTIALNRQSWTGQTMVVANSDLFARFNLDEEPAAILGASLFQDHSLAIDFTGHRLYLGPPVPSGPPRS
jgi:predicted aspartyl protease